MPAVLDARLRVDPVEGKPGRRRLVVSYELTIDEADLISGTNVVQQAVVRSRDLHDAPTSPQQLAIEIERTEVMGEPGVLRRELTCDVKRIDLDVQQDWWRTGHGGEIEAIAEMPDHLVADITISIGGELVAEATTPVLSGSWGALGHS